MIADEIKKLADLRSAGIITDEEFQKKKTELLNETSSADKTGPALDERYQSIYCSQDEKIIFGLCGGLAHKFGVPVAAMRFIVFISLFVFIGWFYFVGLFLPKLPTKNVPRPK